MFNGPYMAVVKDRFPMALQADIRSWADLLGHSVVATALSLSVSCLVHAWLLPRQQWQG